MPRTPENRAEVLAAVPTLFDDAGELDLVATAAYHRWLADHVDGVFVAGTTGEFPALDPAERRALCETALAVSGPGRVVVHVGAASTRQSVALARDAVAAGARRLAVLTPYYLSVDVDAVQRHFAAVIDAAAPASVYGYLFTERTGVVLEPGDLGRIAEATGLAGVKLSGAANARVAEYIDALPAGARLWSGADTSLATVVRHGGAGLVAGSPSAFPEPFRALADAVSAGDADAERGAQAQVDAVSAAIAGTITGIKHALRLRGHGNGLLRMPAVAVPEPAAIARLVPAAVR